MTTELIIFGAALTAISAVNHAYVSSADQPQSNKKVVAHIEYLLGATLLLFAIPVTMKASVIVAFGVLAAVVYAGISWSANRIAERYTIPSVRTTTP